MHWGKQGKYIQDGSENIAVQQQFAVPHLRTEKHGWFSTKSIVLLDFGKDLISFQITEKITFIQWQKNKGYINENRHNMLHEIRVKGPSQCSYM